MMAVLIIGMGLVVFANRYVFLEPRLPLRPGRQARAFLGFAVPGMLTAICGPIVLLRDGQPDLHPDNPYLLSALATIVLVLLTRHTLLSMLAGMTFFFVLGNWPGRA